MTRQCMFMLLFPSCLCSRTRRLMLQQCSTISLACQVTGCTFCLRREQKNMVPSLSTLSPHLPCSLPLSISLFLWPQAFLTPQDKFYKRDNCHLQSLTACRHIQFSLVSIFCFWRKREKTQFGYVAEVNKIQCSLWGRFVSSHKVNTKEQQLDPPVSS